MHDVRGSNHVRVQDPDYLRDVIGILQPRQTPMERADRVQRPTERPKTVVAHIRLVVVGIAVPDGEQAQRTAAGDIAHQHLTHIPRHRVLKISLAVARPHKATVLRGQTVQACNAGLANANALRHHVARKVAVHVQVLVQRRARVLLVVPRPKPRHHVLVLHPFAVGLTIGEHRAVQLRTLTVYQAELPGDDAGADVVLLQQVANLLRHVVTRAPRHDSHAAHALWVAVPVESFPVQEVTEVLRAMAQRNGYRADAAVDNPHVAGTVHNLTLCLFYLLLCHNSKL